MSSCETIDQMMHKLESLRRVHGGDCRIVLKTHGRELLVPFVYAGATGKGDQWRLVSRGGNPVVVIGE